MEYIDSAKASHPDLSVYYDALGDYYQQKLWHQLSIALFEFLSVKQNCRGNSFHELYTSFIKNIESRLSQVKLAQLASFVANSLGDPESSIIFLQEVLEGRKRLGVDASMILEMDIVLMNVLKGDSISAKTLLEAGKELITNEKVTASETVVFSRFYKAETEYRKLVGPPQEFYKAALMFLVYTPADMLPMDERFVLATDMVLAAITADGVYNFGEVVMTPILKSLDGTANSWLKDLILAMHKGSIAEFNKIFAANQANFMSHPALANRIEVVKQKLTLLALMDLAFRMHPHERTISFANISSVCMIPVDQVEWILMRGMSLNLIKGSIDEVAQTVNITWVLPRVLDLEQISALDKQIDDWSVKVKKMLVTIEDQTPELYV